VSEFVRGGGGTVGITFTTENMKVIVGGWNAKQSEVSHRGSKCFGSKDIQQMDSSVQIFDPIGGGHSRLEQQGAHNIVEGVNDALSSTVLRRRVRAGHA
jgi:hypothetical protein